MAAVLVEFEVGIHFHSVSCLVVTVLQQNWHLANLGHLFLAGFVLFFFKSWVLRSCHTKQAVAVTCSRVKIKYMTHAVRQFRPNSTGNELAIEMAWQRRSVIGLFTELSHVHVTRGDRMNVRYFCRRDVSYEFKPIWRRLAAGTCRGDKSPRVTGPFKSSFACVMYCSLAAFVSPWLVPCCRSSEEWVACLASCQTPGN